MAVVRVIYDLFGDLSLESLKEKGSVFLFCFLLTVWEFSNAVNRLMIERFKRIFFYSCESFGAENVCECRLI